MPFTVTMPKLSPTMEEGTIVKWHKKVGDAVEAGELLLEVATDKATIEYNALDEGWLRQILVEEGSEAAVNQAVAIFTEEESESIEGYQPKGITPAKEPTETPEEAPAEEKPQPVAAGIAQPAFTPEPPLEEYRFEVSQTAHGERILGSPLARRLAREKGLDLTGIKGTGPRGRIMSRDLQEAHPSSGAAFPTEKAGSYTEETLTPMRKAIARRLQESKSFIPHFYVQQAVDVEPLDAFRRQLSNIGQKVSFNDCIIRACALALREHPGVNSGFNSVNNTIIRFKTIDISVAVSVEAGLITPIVRYADFKNLGQISLEVRSLAKKAREGDLEVQEYKGGSFTVSNLGMYGITDFQAIINPPQAAILAVSGISNVPVIRDGQVIPGKVMNITLSADHRVIDGVLGAQFVKTVQKHLENPASLIL